MAKRTHVGMRLTEDCIAILDETASRLGGLSRASVVELLTRAYARELEIDTLVPINSIAVPGARRGRVKKSADE